MDGIINIYKEQDYTSHDVVARLRGILHTKKIGHTGTLDPMAEGVLPVCVGNATKLCELLTDHDKEYIAQMVLGRTYDTLDVTGNLLGEREVMSTNKDIEEAVKSFVGGYDQTPPMYSAKKVGGKKLCDLARSGVEVERKSVFVDIYSIDILSAELPYVRIKVSCGRGTYIRSLIDDIGKKLGCGAAMSALTRTKVGSYSIDGAYRLSEIEAAMDSGRISDVMQSLESVFDGIDSLYTTGDMSKLVRNGNALGGKDVRKEAGVTERCREGSKIKVYDANRCFVGVYEYKTARDIYKPYKMFLT